MSQTMREALERARQALEHCLNWLPDDGSAAIEAQNVISEIVGLRSAPSSEQAQQGTDCEHYLTDAQIAGLREVALSIFDAQGSPQASRDIIEWFCGMLKVQADGASRPAAAAPTIADHDAADVSHKDAGGQSVTCKAPAVGVTDALRAVIREAMEWGRQYLSPAPNEVIDEAIQHYAEKVAALAGAAQGAEPDLIAALREAWRPLDRTQEWTPEHSKVYPQKAATIINAARRLSLAASPQPPTGTERKP